MWAFCKRWWAELRFKICPKKQTGNTSTWSDSWTWSHSEYTRQIVIFLDVISLVSKLHRRASKHDLPSQSLYKGPGKQWELNWPPSSVYPRGPKFKPRNTLVSALHARTTQVHRRTPMQVQVSTQAWMLKTVADSYPCMHAKGTNVNWDT